MEKQIQEMKQFCKKDFTSYNLAIILKMENHKATDMQDVTCSRNTCIENKGLLL